MATKVVVSVEERKMILEGLSALVLINARAQKSAKNPAIADLLGKDAVAAQNLVAKLSTGELEF